MTWREIKITVGSGEKRTKKKEKDSLDASTSVKQIYSALLHFRMVTYLRKRTLVHINGDVTSRIFLFICHKKGWTKARTGSGL